MDPKPGASRRYLLFIVDIISHQLQLSGVQLSQGDCVLIVSATKSL